MGVLDLYLPSINQLDVSIHTSTVSRFIKFRTGNLKVTREQDSGDELMNIKSHFHMLLHGTDNHYSTNNRRQINKYIYNMNILTIKDMFNNN